ncbi:MAG: hypothetical protein AABZ39_07375 [Spirochaetota bacterium]
MEIKKIPYEGIDNCYECIADGKRLVITAAFGPRILHASVGKSGNLLYIDTKRELGLGDWKIYGGHRLWTSPEANDSYSPDNFPCTVRVENGECAVTFLDEKTDLEKSIIIGYEEGRFRITHRFINRGIFLYPAALWALTCVKPAGTVFIPWGSRSKEWETKKIIYWKKWGGVHSSTLRSPQYVEGDDLFLVKPTGEEGKIGTAGHEGFIGISTPQATFMKSFTRQHGAVYPDDNCAIECYTCDKFIELETLSPEYMLEPNVTYEHTEEWLLIDSAVDPNDGAAVRRLLS